MNYFNYCWIRCNVCGNAFLVIFLGFELVFRGVRLWVRGIRGSVRVGCFSAVLLVLVLGVLVSLGFGFLMCFGYFTCYLSCWYIYYFLSILVPIQVGSI